MDHRGSQDLLNICGISGGRPCAGGAYLFPSPRGRAPLAAPSLARAQAAVGVRAGGPSCPPGTPTQAHGWGPQAEGERVNSRRAELGRGRRFDASNCSRPAQCVCGAHLEKMLDSCRSVRSGRPSGNSYSSALWELQMRQKRALTANNRGPRSHELFEQPSADILAPCGQIVCLSVRLVPLGTDCNAHCSYIAGRRQLCTVGQAQHSTKPEARKVRVLLYS